MRRRGQGLTFNFPALASLRWLASNVRNSRAPHHPSSPSNSAARISATSLAEKMRSPQVAFKRAMMSGILNRRGFFGAAGTERVACCLTFLRAINQAIAGSSAVSGSTSRSICFCFS